MWRSDASSREQPEKAPDGEECMPDIQQSCRAHENRESLSKGCARADSDFPDLFCREAGTTMYSSTSALLATDRNFCKEGRIWFKITCSGSMSQTPKRLNTVLIVAWRIGSDSLPQSKPAKPSFTISGNPVKHRSANQACTQPMLSTRMEELQLVLEPISCGRGWLVEVCTT